MLTANADRVVNSVSNSTLYTKFRNSDSGFLHHVQPTFIPVRHRDQRLTELRRFSEGKSVFFRCLLTAQRWIWDGGESRCDGTKAPKKYACTHEITGVFFLNLLLDQLCNLVICCYFIQTPVVWGLCENVEKNWKKDV